MEEEKNELVQKEDQPSLAAKTIYCPYCETELIPGASGRVVCNECGFYGYREE